MKELRQLLGLVGVLHDLQDDRRGTLSAFGPLGRAHRGVATS
jgi:hypothetical protein